jgi:hypothetical protein
MIKYLSGKEKMIDSPPFAMRRLSIRSYTIFYTLCFFSGLETGTPSLRRTTAVAFVGGRGGGRGGRGGMGKVVTAVITEQVSESWCGDAFGCR